MKSTFRCLQPEWTLGPIAKARRSPVSSERPLFRSAAREKVLCGATEAQAIRSAVGPKSKDVLREKKWENSVFGAGEFPLLNPSSRRIPGNFFIVQAVCEPAERSRKAVSDGSRTLTIRLRAIFSKGRRKGAARGSAVDLKGSSLEHRMVAASFEARWEHFPHGSDIGVRGFGQSIEQAFEQAAVALAAVVADVSAIQPSEAIEVSCSAPDLEMLLMSWLNLVIYEMAVRKMLFSKFRVFLSGCSLTGTLFGETVDPERHHLAVEAKGATVTALRVERGQNRQWLAQCVVDV
jgi:SHS2 domain-containing protein